MMAQLPRGDSASTILGKNAKAKINAIDIQRGNQKNKRGQNEEDESHNGARPSLRAGTASAVFAAPTLPSEGRPQRAQLKPLS